MKDWCLALAVFAAALGLSCEKGEATEPPVSTTLSPNASILPEPLASVPPRVGLNEPIGNTVVDPVRYGGSSDAGHGRPSDGGDGGASADAMARHTPKPLRGDEALDQDITPPRDAVTVSLEAEWRYPDLPSAARVPEQNPAGLEAARKATALRWTVDLASHGRMRVSFASRAFAVERESELRARSDRLGHLLVWPSGLQYRVLPPGAVRTLLAERRTDAIPLVPALVTGSIHGPKRIGRSTRRWELATRTGKLLLEQTRIAQSGDGGSLLCRLLVELIAADPLVAPCSADEVPVRAQYTWPQGGGGISFEVATLSERLGASSSTYSVPPTAAGMTSIGFPSSDAILLGREELASLRSRSLDFAVQPAQDGQLEGLAAFNATDLLRFLFVDGVAVAAVAPGRVEYALGLARGRYTVQWRTFLGDTAEPAQAVDVPARISIGAADAGTVQPRQPALAPNAELTSK